MSSLNLKNFASIMRIVRLQSNLTANFSNKPRRPDIKKANAIFIRRSIFLSRFYVLSNEIICNIVTIKHDENNIIRTL